MGFITFLFMYLSYFFRDMPTRVCCRLFPSDGNVFLLIYDCF